MNKLYLILPAILMYCNTCRAQDVFLKNVRAMEAGNEINLEVLASFYPVTSSFYYIQIIGQDTVTTSNQYVLKLYYFFPLLISGIPMRYDKTDTVSLGVLPANIKEIMVEMYTVQDGDTVPDTIFRPPPISVFLPLTINDINTGQDKINVYPNPNNGRFVIETSPPANFVGDPQPSPKERELILVEIINTLGQVVYSDKIVPENRKIHKEIDLGNVAAGVYLLRLHTGDEVNVVRFSVR